MNGSSYKRLLAALMAALLLCVSLAGCTDETQAEGNHAAIRVAAVEAKALQETGYEYKDLIAETTARGANDFAFRLSGLLAEGVDDQNFVCSPYSVWLPLAALTNATDEGHREALLTALGAAGVTEEDLNRAASRMLYDLRNESYKAFLEDYPEEEYHNPLHIANVLFVGRDAAVKQDFVQAFADSYLGSVIQVDFTAPEAVEEVNTWAAEQTGGLITDLVQEFDPNTVAAIANAIYFSARWTQEFNPEETAEDVFYASSGETRAHYMLREGDDLTYFEDEQIQAVKLSFEGGGSMYILLPKDGDATGLLCSMTGEYFNQIVQNAEWQTGKLLLPRFSIESDTMELSEILQTMGVPLFDQGAAPLTGGLLEGEMPLWLSGVMQKALIEVDERGTTAAAVTMMGMGMGGPMPTEPFEMICNTPFVFVLCGQTYDGGNQVLFTGVVNQP